MYDWADHFDVSKSTAHQYIHLFMKYLFLKSKEIISWPKSSELKVIKDHFQAKYHFISYQFQAKYHLT